MTGPHRPGLWDVRLGPWCSGPVPGIGGILGAVVCEAFGAEAGSLGVWAGFVTTATRAS